MSPDPKAIDLPIYSETANFQVSPDLGEVHFACDLDVCKGACCTMPAAAGAPILESEIAELERVFPAVEKYLQPEALAVIETHGIWERDIHGALTIPAIRGRDCIFVCYDDQEAGESGWKHRPTGDSDGSRRSALPARPPQQSRIAYCAIEKAHRAGEITGFPKPISCHLFPIRIYPTGPDNSFEIVYEEIPECKGGRACGKREKISVVDFLESPLVRALGEERVARLREALSASK
jgi:hypothetical protein